MWLFFLLFLLNILAYSEKDPHLNVFSSVWNKTEGGVQPFVFSLSAFRSFKENTLLSLWKKPSSNCNTALWREYIRAYKDLYEWYFTIPLYAKTHNEAFGSFSVAHNFLLYELAPHKGKGVKVGCIDTGTGIITADGEYDIHPALQKCILEVPITYCNCIEDLVRIVFYDVAVPYSSWCSRFRFLEDRLYRAVLEYLNGYSLEPFTIFLKRYGNQNLFITNDRTQFSQRGYSLLEVITQKIQKILPIVLNGKKVPNDTICSSCTVSTYLHSTNHGSGIAGIIAGKSLDYEGVAPEATIVMANVFSQSVRCTAQTFLEGLLMMIKHKIPIVCMSLQIPEDAISDEMRIILTDLIKLIPYSIAPSGNNALTKAYLSFPGSVSTFSIGSFFYDSSKNIFPIASCSQYAIENGPLYVMPGTAFVMPYTRYYNQKIEHTYSVSHGTSFSAAFTAGLLALFLGEIDVVPFSRQEILTILYSSGFFLDETSDWKLKSILGTLDISTALFVLLVLRAVKQESSTMRYLCEFFFEQCVAIIHVLLNQEKYITKYTKEDNVIFCKTIICSLIEQDSIYKTMIPTSLQKICLSLLHTPKECIFSEAVKSALEKNVRPPKTLDYNLLVRVYGIYEAERIKEYVDSYMHYYW